MEPTVGEVQEDGKSSNRLDKQFQKLNKRWLGTEYNIVLEAGKWMQIGKMKQWR